MLKLLKALCGTEEAAKLWYSHFRATLESCGYVKSELGKCAFHRASGDGTAASVATHVDDGLALAESAQGLHTLLESLCRSFEGKLTHTLGRVRTYLGVRVTQYSGCATVDMTSYTGDTCSEYEVLGVRTVPAGTD